MTDKEMYMRRAIELASKGLGQVNPNPLVGAVIVKDGKIIGEGNHEMFGGPHAEVQAFNQAIEDVEGADMYVTLEPCSHYGKTPPCALKIIDKKIKNVYISQLDPNPLVNHKGVDLLERAGIHVEYGFLEQESKKQNEIFLKYIQEKRPFVAMKFAMTLDGKIATFKGDSKWISNETSRRFVHDLRHKYMAIMVGVQTVIDDDPHLDTRREKSSRNPIRFVIDPHLRTPLDAYVVKTAKAQKTFIVTDVDADKDKLVKYEKLGVNIIKKASNPNIDLNELMNDIGQLGIDSLLIEGGSYLHGKALDMGIIDKVYAFIAPKIIGSKEAKSAVHGDGIAYMKDAITLENTTHHLLDGDNLIEGYIKH